MFPSLYYTYHTIIPKTNRKRDSFIPVSLRLLNDKRL